MNNLLLAMASIIFIACEKIVNNSDTVISKKKSTAVNKDAE